MMNIEVIIVGGGLSGLYAARLLEKAGINYLLLEGRERMGGRILQANTVEADLGATWFWPTIQPALKQLFRELNIESFSHQERGDMLFERSKDAPSRHPGFVSSPAAARVSGGMSRLPDALLAKLKPERIQTGLQVKHIELTTAAFLASAFFVGASGAWHLLKGRETRQQSAKCSLWRYGWQPLLRRFRYFWAMGTG